MRQRPPVVDLDYRCVTVVPARWKMLGNCYAAGLRCFSKPESLLDVAARTQRDLRLHQSTRVRARIERPFWVGERTRRAGVRAKPGEPTAGSIQARHHLAPRRNARTHRESARALERAREEDVYGAVGYRDEWDVDEPEVTQWYFEHRGLA